MPANLRGFHQGLGVSTEDRLTRAPFWEVALPLSLCLPDHNRNEENPLPKTSLPTEETLDLIRRFQCGDLQAGEQLLHANSGLVAKIANTYLRYARSLEFDDLEIAGQLGLIHAARRFDAGRG